MLFSRGTKTKSSPNACSKSGRQRVYVQVIPACDSAPGTLLISIYLANPSKADIFLSARLSIIELLSMNDETFLVVGGCGLLGFYIVLDLKANHPESEIHVVDTKSPLADRTLDTVRYHRCDITDGEAVAKLMQDIRPTVIINTASPRPFVHGLDVCLRINHGGTKNLIESASHVGSLKAFVYTSSSSVVHDSIGDMINIDETARVLYLPEQKEPYHHSKAVAEKYVLDCNRENGSRILTCVLRPSGIFGPGDDYTIPQMVQSAKDGKFKWQIGGGKNLFDWTYVENVSRAHVLAAEKLLMTHGSPEADTTNARRADGETFFITNGQPVPFWDFARSVGAAAGYPTDVRKVTVIPKRLAFALGIAAEWVVWLTSLGRRTATFNHRSLRYSTQIRIFNITKAKERLGYKPSFTVEEGIEKSCAPYHRSHGE